MAKIVSRKNKLKKKYYGRIILSIIYLFSAFVSFIGIIPTRGVSALIFILFAFLYFKNQTNIKILKHGLKGEQKALKQLSKLPKDYYVFSDININIDNRSSQIDHIVVGYNGVFVIETKNLKGLVEVYSDNKVVRQSKVGKNGGEYSKTIYNPIKQVSTHVYKVSELLRREDIKIWVQGVVFFVNEEATIKLQSKDIPVFSSSEHGDKRILEFIINYRNRDGKLSESVQEEIVTALKTVC